MARIRIPAPVTSAEKTRSPAREGRVTLSRPSLPTVKAALTDLLRPAADRVDGRLDLLRDRLAQRSGPGGLGSSLLPFRADDVTEVRLHDRRCVRIAVLRAAEHVRDEHDGIRVRGVGSAVQRVGELVRPWI